MVLQLLHLRSLVYSCLDNLASWQTYKKVLC